MTNTLVGLSIQQPWIDMVVRGAKNMELRGWPARHSGLVGLHAPWRIDFAAAYFYGYKNPGDLPRGGVIAVAEISDVLELNELMYERFLERHRHPLPMLRGTYGALLKNVRPLAKLVSCPGSPGLFAVPPGVERRIREDPNFPR